MDIKALLEIKAELKRFDKKLDAAVDRLKKDGREDNCFGGTYETGAVKRAALDLKNELTRITQNR